MLQLVSRSNIALNKETLQLLDTLDGFEHYALLKHQEFIIYIKNCNQTSRMLSNSKASASGGLKLLYSMLSSILC